MDLSRLVSTTRERVVAVEYDSIGKCARVFERGADGAVTESAVPFEPFVVVKGAGLAEALSGISHIENLAGVGEQRLVYFPAVRHTMRH